MAKRALGLLFSKPSESSAIESSHYREIDIRICIPQNDYCIIIFPLSSICFVCIKEMSQGDISFTHTKHMFDRGNVSFMHTKHVFIDSI